MTPSVAIAATIYALLLAWVASLIIREQRRAKAREASQSRHPSRLPRAER